MTAVNATAMTICSHEAPGTGDDSLAFGRFQLSRTKRVLLRAGQPVAVGSRAMEILVALTERAGTILSNAELLRRVWPDTIVEGGAIRVHVSQLRRIFRDADPHVEYVQTVTGRGYRFVVPVSPPDTSADPDSANQPTLSSPVRQPSRKYNLPPRAAPIIGRARSICTLADKVRGHRLVTICGPGGSGKTTLAVSVADILAMTLRHGVCFVDLASITEARLVPGVLASALGVALGAVDPLPDILACLSKRSALLLLDNCEHVLGAAAKLVERVLQDAPHVHVLATSREPLRSASESVYDLEPLEAPSERCSSTRSHLLEYSAIRLFVERALACADTEISDDDLLRVADICRRLAGNALAIEITAAHVRLLGVKALAESLQDDLYLSMSGRNTAEPRHRTLRATFDWSYSLLSSDEQRIFRALSVFTGEFDLDRAVAVAVADRNLTQAAVFESLMGLVRKSLVVADTTGEKPRYRLLDLMRAYAREKLRESEAGSSPAAT